MKKPNAVPDRARVLKSPLLLLAFGFGSGLSPVLPGTMGTLAAVPLYYALVQLGWLGYGLVILAAAVAGVYLCGHAAKKLGVHDHSGIVWDEFVGFWLTMFLAPPGWEWVFIGFVLFRFFDMFKPWPISLLDRHVHGGFGIMVDDIAAGLAAWACLQGLAMVV